MTHHAAKKVSKRPPKGWWKHCVQNVSESGVAVDVSRVCGALWRDMSPRARKRAKCRHPEHGKGRHQHSGRCPV